MRWWRSSPAAQRRQCRSGRDRGGRAFPRAAQRMSGLEGGAMMTGSGDPQSDAPPAMTWAGHELRWGARTYVMGVLNITPDSFSGDGLAPAGVTGAEVVAVAVARGRAMVEAGADLLDVGGESTRPGTEQQAPLDADTERARVVPVVQALAAALPGRVPISIDTTKAQVAEAALDAGASLVNDTACLCHDAAIAP